MRLRPTIAITPDTPALVVSVPAVPLEYLLKLKDADDEANSVAERFRSAPWLRDSAATLSAIRREIRGVGVFHFAGHAIASPQRSGLALDEADPNSKRARLLGANSFTAEEIKSLQLAVLSACPTQPETGIGTTGTESLARSLLLAGTPHIIASRWEVDSRGTAEFMKQLYALLFTDRDIAHATQRAQLTIAARPEFAHPYYWSAFELQGN
jgi:CHAT domain-containing protein